MTRPERNRTIRNEFTFYVNPDHQSITLMYAFPNYIPVSAATVRRAAAAIEPFAFRRLYGQWWDAVVDQDGKNVIRRSAERYIAATEGRYDAPSSAIPDEA